MAAHALAIAVCRPIGRAWRGVHVLIGPLRHSMVLREVVEIGIDVRPAGDGAADHVGGDPRIGRAVAAVAKRNPGARPAWNAPDPRQSRAACPE